MRNLRMFQAMSLLIGVLLALSDTPAQIKNAYGQSIGAYTVFNPPGGRITLQTGTPVMFAPVTGATTVYYTIDQSGLVPVYNSTLAAVGVSNFQSDMSQALSDTTLSPAATVANKAYDYFVSHNSSGVLQFSRGPAWHETGNIISAATNATPIVITSVGHGVVTGDTVTVNNVEGNTAANGTWTSVTVSGNNITLTGSVGSAAYTQGGSVAARGNGSGTAELKLLNAGLWVNGQDIKSGGGATVITQYQGTYVGTIVTTNGNTVSWQASTFGAAGIGQAHMRVYNHYNKRNFSVTVGDTTSSWHETGTAAWEQMNAATTAVYVAQGFNEDSVTCTNAVPGTNNAASSAMVGCGLNSFLLSQGTHSFNTSTTTIPLIGTFSGSIGLGLNTFYAVQYCAATQCTYAGSLLGSQSGMTLQFRM